MDTHYLQKKLCTPAQVLEIDPVAALEAKRGAGLVGSGDFIAELLDDAPNLGDLLGIGAGELALADEQAVLQAGPDIAAGWFRDAGSDPEPAELHCPRLYRACSGYWRHC
jgi:hypothetical protein